MPIYTDNKANILYDHDYGPVAWVDPNGEMISGYEEKSERAISEKEFFTEYKTKRPIVRIEGNTKEIIDDTYKSGLVIPYDTFRTNQIIPNGIINLTLTTTAAASKNAIGDYISKWLTVEQRVGHKVYAKLTTTNDRLRVCFFKGYEGDYDTAFDFATGQVLNGQSNPPSMKESIYTITQDMVYTDGYTQLYWYKFANLPAGTYRVVIQMVDLTEIYGAGNEPTNLVILKAQHPEINEINDYGYHLIAATENLKSHKLPLEYQETEYLECFGEQYIDTKVYGTQNTKVIFSFQCTNISKPNGFLGNTMADTDRAFVISTTNANNRVVALSCNASGTVSVQNLLPDTILRNYEVSNKDGFWVNGALYRTFPKGSNFTTTETLKFLRTDQNLGTERIVKYAYGKAYPLKIFENNVLMGYFIPCYRKSDKKPGMYDIIGKDFYINKGAGDFAVGPDVYDYSVTINNDILILLTTPLYKFGNIADTMRTNVGVYQVLAKRGYQEGDKDNPNVFTDGVNETIYPLEEPIKIPFAEPYKFQSITSAADIYKQLTVEVRDDHTKHLENAQTAEYRSGDQVISQILNFDLRSTGDIRDYIEVTKDKVEKHILTEIQKDEINNPIVVALSTPIIEDVTNSELGDILLRLNTSPNTANIVEIDNEGIVYVNYCVYTDDFDTIRRLKISDLKLFVTSDHKDFYTK